MILDGVILHLEISANRPSNWLILLMVNQQNNKFNWNIFKCSVIISANNSAGRRQYSERVRVWPEVLSPELFGDLPLLAQQLASWPCRCCSADVRVAAPLWLSHGNNLITITQFYHSTQTRTLGLLSFVLPALCFPPMVGGGCDHWAMCDGVQGMMMISTELLNTNKQRATDFHLKSSGSECGTVEIHLNDEDW